jgi:signal transduction histidine kinase
MRQTVSFRLTAWHAVIFVTSVLALFLVVDFALDRSLQKLDQQSLVTGTKEVADEYGEGGMEAVAKMMREEDTAAFLVRLADTNNQTLFSSATATSLTDKLAGLPADKSRSLRTSIIGETGEHFDICTTILADGSRLQVGLSQQSRHLFLSRFRRVCGAIMLPMTALGIIGGAVFARRTLRPIHDLSETIRRVQQTGKLDERIPAHKAPGELMELVESFNRMLARIETLVGSMRGSLDNVAHELRTPMTRLRASAETALRHSGDRELAEVALADCVEESERAMTLLNLLTDIAEAEAGAMKLHLEPIDVAKVAHRIAGLYGHVADEKGVGVTVSIPNALVFNGDANRLSQAVANLVDNAIKYTPSGGRVSIGGSTQNGEVALSVNDTGIGIPAAEHEKVWERLYRADKSRFKDGLGLGLTLVKAIVEAHGGRVTLESELDCGSTFTLRFPTR